MQTIRVFESFAGYGSQLMALRRLEQAFPDQIKVVPVGISEIDAHAIKAYHAVHGEDVPNYGDISKIDWAQVPDFDLFTYSSPCFVAGTLVNTKRGMIPIEEVRVGDEVLTHKNRYQKVLRTGSKVSNDLYRIKGMSFDEIVCTGNHPFYTREMYHYGHNSDRLFREPKWVEAKDLNKQTYCSVAINQESEMPKWNGGIDNRWGHHKEVNRLAPQFALPDFWYLMGRYVGDGWTRESDTGRSVIICCGGRNEERLQKAFTNVQFHARAQKERSVTKYIVCSNELYEFVKRYGYYAHGKEVDAETMALPIEMLSAFLDGYTDSDGCYSQKTRLYKYTTVSQKLVYGIAQCIAKVQRRPYAVYRTARPKKTVIEGRIVNQKDSFEVRFKKEHCLQDHAFTEDGTIWFPIQKVERLDGQTATVYNLEVENDNSYTANGVIVHNCQDFSSAGLQRGGEKGSGTRSSLLWECERAIAEKRPKWLLMENVAALVSGKFIKLFNKWQRTLEKYGYHNFAQVLNAKDYGVPQNRERIFMVSIHDEAARFYFPKPIPLTKRLKDVLEHVVDECYYINDIQVQKVLNSSFAQERNRLQQEVAGEARARDYKDPKLVCVGSLQGGVWDARNDSTKRVYSADGIAPTQNCCEGGGLQTKIVEPNNQKE